MLVRRSLSGLAIFIFALCSLVLGPSQEAIAACRTLSQSKGVETGTATSYAWSKSGLAFSWGKGDSGERGDSSKEVGRNFPSRVKLSKKIVKVSSFASHALFLTSDGHVFATGANNYGQLGMGNTKTLWTPKQVPGLSCITDIEVGANNSFALKSDGTVWAWGLIHNTGKPSNESETVKKPIRLKGLPKIKRIFAGADAFFAVGSSAVYKFGGDLEALLEHPDSELTPQPFIVTLYPGSNWYSKMSISWRETLAIAPDSGQFLFGWGRSDLPSTYYARDRNPLYVEDYLGWGPIQQVALGKGHGLVVRNGELYSWGNNESGALGSDNGFVCNPSEQTYRNPCVGQGADSYLQVTDPIKILDKVANISANDYFSVALRLDGSIWTWGNGEFGQLGTATRPIYGFFGSYTFESYDVPQKIGQINLNH